MPNRSSTDASKELIEAHRRWIADIGKQLDLTPTQIAKKVGLTATTLTRLANDPDHPHALSATTINKITKQLGVAPPTSPDFSAFREAVWKTVFALHKVTALQQAAPDTVANTVLDLADWLLSTGKDPEQFDAIVSFEAERLKKQR